MDDDKRVNADIERAIKFIDGLGCAGPDVPPRASVEFFEGLAEQLKDRAEGLREEFGVEG